MTVVAFVVRLVLAWVLVLVLLQVVPTLGLLGSAVGG